MIDKKNQRTINKNDKEDDQKCLLRRIKQEKGNSFIYLHFEREREMLFVCEDIESVHILSLFYTQK